MVPVISHLRTPAEIGRRVLLEMAISSTQTQGKTGYPDKKRSPDPKIIFVEVCHVGISCFYCLRGFPGAAHV